MSALHQRLAWEVLGLEPTERLLLLAYARHACEHCGLCWPGVRRLQILTGLGETTISGASKALVARRLLKIHAYPRGGRGRSTEYIVLPEDAKLSTAPCGKCEANQKTPRDSAGI